MDGNARCQYNIANCCLNGDGVSVDNLEAYKWLSLACNNCSPEGLEPFSQLRDTVRNILYTSDINQAEREAESIQKRISSNLRQAK